MKITSFNPMIVTEKSEEIIAFFEELGFEKKHKKKSTDNEEIYNTILEDSNSFKLDIIQTNELPQGKDIMAIRINVDDFDEAYAFLLERGFKNIHGDKISDTGTSRTAILLSPSGFAIDLLQHIKE